MIAPAAITPIRLIPRGMLHPALPAAAAWAALGTASALPPAMTKLERRVDAGGAARVGWRSGLAGALTLAVGMGAGGCVGNIGDGTEGGPGVGGPGGNDPNNVVCGDGSVHTSALPLRRLSPEQYQNTVRDLFGDAEFAGTIDAGEPIISEREVRQLRDNAEAIIGRSAAWTKPVYPCALQGEGSDACVDDFIAGFATRAYRHPLSEAEASTLRSVFAEARKEMTFAEAMETLLQVTLQAPAFVYMFSAGAPDATEDVRLLGEYEVASRLSYFLWNTMPDEALVSAAEAGKLGAAEGLAEQAARLLDDPRADHAVQRFMSGWLQLDGGTLHNALEEAVKDTALYPTFDAQLQEAMRLETEAFVRRAFFEESGSLGDLFNASYAYVNGPLADLYGVEDGPADADTWEWVDLDPEQRGGILTRAAFLTVFSTRNVTSPIRRGVWVIEEGLCSALGDPPPNANDVKPEGGEVDGELLTVRQDTLARTKGEVCQTCHSIINPVGFTFESYDAIGRWQTEEITSGLPIDDSGLLQSSGDQDGELAGALDLSQRLGKSERVRGCFADRWFEAALGQAPGKQDKCSLEAVHASFEEGGSMRDMVLSIIGSDAFRYLNISQETP